MLGFFPPAIFAIFNENNQIIDTDSSEYASVSDNTSKSESESESENTDSISVQTEHEHNIINNNGHISVPHLNTSQKEQADISDSIPQVDILVPHSSISHTISHQSLPPHIFDPYANVKKYAHLICTHNIYFTYCAYSNRMT